MAPGLAGALLAGLLRLVLLIGGSMAGNYATGRGLMAPRLAHRWRRPLLTVGIAGNLLLLGYFKYTDFIIVNINALSGSQWGTLGIILPIGISFFTFQQIAYLVDAYRGLTRDHSALHYALFVTFFPQLIAGPIVHHQELLPQFKAGINRQLWLYQICQGLTFLAIGLGKKLLLADTISVYATPVFTMTDSMTMQTLEVWAGGLSYTFQLYFDFSGYCDMAIGLGLLFGIRLPINFSSPYKAGSMIEFWRCWHMTLSRFLRDYLYIPLGGNRHGQGRRYGNLMITMVLGGIWHGAGWTFLVWGALHGLYLLINHGWLTCRQRLGWWVAAPGQLAPQLPLWYRGLSWAVTFAAVAFSLVIFRADSWPIAVKLCRAMLALDGLALPFRLQPIFETLGIHGWHFSRLILIGKKYLILLLILSLIAWVMPNSQTIMRYHPDQPLPPAKPPAWWQWRPDWRWACATGGLAAACFLSLSKVSEFLYFQF
jgi:alginate O-acetyltransferase complex protein AlgI